MSNYVHHPPFNEDVIIWLVVSNIFLFLPLLGEMIQFDEHIFQMGWFNHQLVIYFLF